MRVAGIQITYEGRSYPSFAALYRAWKGDKPSEKTFGFKLAKWRKRNPGTDLTDEIIRQLFRTRSAAHGLRFRDVAYAGPKDLHRAYDGEKISFGGFWQRLDEWRRANPDVEPDDSTLAVLLAPEILTYRSVGYPSLTQLHKAIPGPKLGLERFTANIRAWKQSNPDSQIDDATWERCAQFMGGNHECVYRGLRFPNLKGLFDAQPQPKCLWGTFQNRVRKLQGLRELTDDDFLMLLQPKAKVKFFKGILYRWTHLPTGKVYIGISSQTLNERIRMHIRQAKDGAYRNPASLQAAIAKDGLLAFKIETLAEFNDEDSMKAAEELAVREHDCLAPKGFNLQEGGRSWTKQGMDVEFEGVLYPSYAALAQAFGISEKLLDGRRRLGWSLHAALTTPAGSKNASNSPVTVRGVEYPSLRAAAKAYGVLYTVLYDRMDKGWSLEDALGLSGRKAATRKAVVVNGVQYPTISAAAHHYGKELRQVYWKMDRGMTIEQALGLSFPSSPDL